MRLLVLVLSLGSIFFYGKALGGLGGYLVDRGSPKLIILGLLGGTLCALGALVLWKRYLESFSDSEKR